MKLKCVLVMCALFLSCASNYQNSKYYRVAGFQAHQKSFMSLKATPHLRKTIFLKNVKITIVGSNKLFSKDWCGASDICLGFATTNNEIEILGTVVNGKIIVNQSVLGHELNHLLNFENEIIADPDEL